MKDYTDFKSERIIYGTAVILSAVCTILYVYFIG